MESLGKLVVNVMSKKTEEVYAIYKGDKFIDVGTANEICKNQGWTKKKFLFLKSPTYQNKPNAGKRLEIFELEEE